jgi:hypothetical protein
MRAVAPRARGADSAWRGGAAAQCELSFSVEWMPLPQNDRFEGFWRVTVVGANAVPNMDKATRCPPAPPPRAAARGRSGTCL